MARIFTLFILFIGVESKINGQYWSSPGGGIGSFQTYDAVYAMNIHNGHLYAAGSFSMAGGINANNIAKWDGTNWTSLGNGINGNVYAIASYNGELYAAGDFTTAGTSSVNDIAKWDGNNWSEVGAGIWGEVSSLVVYNGELYAGGFFVTAGGQSAKSIAKWNGTNWSAVGPGLVFSSYTGYVAELQVYNGELYAGGNFTHAGTLEVPGIAKWNGSAWFAVGGGVDGTIYAMASHNNELYVGGEFLLPGNASGNNIAKWNGSSWAALGNGVNNSVYSLHSYDGNLYAGGIFSNAGSYIAKWDNINWSAVSGGMDDVVMCMKPYNNDLYAGGYFLSAGPTNVFRIAKLSDTCTTAPLQPGPIVEEAYCGSLGFYHIMPVTDATGYTWTLPSGWSGSSTTISISATVGTAGGILSVTANNSCGSSAASTITVNGLTQLGPISGNDSVCQNSTQSYSVAPMTNAAEYWWTLPNGWIGSNFSPSITVNAGSSSGIIRVYVYDLCGEEIGSSQLPVFVAQLPIQPGNITGEDTVCSGSTHAYSIGSAPNATGYTWTVPPGWAASPNGNNILVTFGNSSGRILVTANYACGAGITRYLDIVVDQPLSTIASIQGDTSICQFTSHQYFINPVPGATGYLWQTPGGWSGTSVSNSITTVANNFGGTIQVTAHNSCGSISSTLLDILVTEPIDQLWVLNGTSEACAGSTRNFEVENHPYAQNYVWTLPSGWTGSSSSPLIQTLVGRFGGPVSVKAYNSCGYSMPVVWTVRVDTIIPMKPVAIEGLEFVETEQSAVYRIDPVTGADHYRWTIQSGGNMGPGLSEAIVNVYWHTPGEHTIAVQAINSCGSSDVQSFVVKVALKGGDDPGNPFDLKVVPNPSNGIFNVLARRAQNKFMNIEVLNLAGQRVYQSGRLGIGTNEFSYPLNLGKMMSGIYFIRVRIEDKIYTIRAVKTN